MTMDWLANAFWAHIGWALSEAVIGLLVLIVIGTIYSLIMAPTMIKRSRCQHLRFHETSSCDAICTDCGKNLGFIGAWRDRLRTLQ
jgi:hypothetical protein